MVIAYLKEHRFDGLYLPDEKGGDVLCGCGVDDLAPCGEADTMWNECEAAYKFKDGDGDTMYGPNKTS